MPFPVARGTTVEARMRPEARATGTGARDCTRAELGARMVSRSMLVALGCQCRNPSSYSGTSTLLILVPIALLKGVSVL